MHKLGLGVATLLLAVSPAHADVFHTLQVQMVAATDFETVSADGCIVTTGQLAAVHSQAEGTYALAAGLRTDHCTGGEPAVRAFLSGGPVTFWMFGLASAKLTGSIDLIPYSGDPTPIVLDIALKLKGTGPVTTNTETYTSTDGGLTMSFTTTSERNATVSGSLTADGDVGTTTNAKLGMQASGELVVVP